MHVQSKHTIRTGVHVSTLTIILTLLRPHPLRTCVHTIILAMASPTTDLCVLVHPHHGVGRVVVAEVHRVGADPLPICSGLELRQNALHETAHLARGGA